MTSTNERLTILSEAEQAALYEVPDFDEEQQLTYLTLTPEEQSLIKKRRNLVTQVYCALQIGYFKAKHRFFRFSLEDVPDDVAFILAQYFSSETLRPEPITDHEHYTQCQLIAKHVGYQFWKKAYEPLVKNEIIKIIRTDHNPEFIIMELLQFFQDKKWILPHYTTLQTLMSEVLAGERNRLAKLIRNGLTEENKNALDALLLEEDTLSKLAEIKQDPKDFKARMMATEREKLTTMKPLYRLAKAFLPQLSLSQKNREHYASLIDYYTIYELRQKIKPEQAYLYLLCYIFQRYCKLSDNLVEAFSCHLLQCENEIKEKTTDDYNAYAVDNHEDNWTMKRLSRYYIDKCISDETRFGDIRQDAFARVIPRKNLEEKLVDAGETPLKKMDFRWRSIDTLFPRFKLHLRPLAWMLDFTSTASNDPWLQAVSWMKDVISKKKNLSDYGESDCPAGTVPKALARYLLETNASGEKKLYATRYEYWIYRRLKAALKTGRICLEDSTQHRSLEHELREACKKSEQVNTLAIPALNQPIAQRLDALVAELGTEWARFDSDLRAGKLKHLHYDEKTQTLHSKKAKDNKAEKLQNRFYAQFPLRDITDVLRFSDENSALSSVFSHIQPRYAKSPLDKNSLYATLIAQAFNNGNLTMADISDIPYSRLFDTYQSRIRLATLRKGNDCIVNVMKNLPIFPFYSLDLLILYGGVDGQKYEVQTHTTKARHSKKYYKKGKGVVAYTLLVNHIPLLTQLIGAHEHESYFTFDIWYNNTTGIIPTAITGDMHSINKANFAIMDWFGAKLYPRFTHVQSQLKHLYAGKPLSEYEQNIIKPVGKIDRQLIEDEWENIRAIIIALGLKEISQSTLIKKLCTHNKNERTLKAIFEYDKLIRSIHTLKYLQDPKMQRDVHRSQNRIESYHQLRSAISQAYGKKQLIGKNDREIEITNECARLVANAIIHYNTAILSKLFVKFQAEGNHRALARLNKISPVAWDHIHFQGHFIFNDKGTVIDLDELVRNLILK